jgi:hypothetical protein
LKKIIKTSIGSIAIYLILVSLTMITSMPSVHASPTTLSLAVTTSGGVKNIYYGGPGGYAVEGNVNVHVNLTQNGSPVNGLVALWVNEPGNNGTIVMRTVQAGTTPTAEKVSIINVSPTQSSFAAGGSAYFNVSFIDNDVVPRTVTVIVNAYDSENIPFDISQNTATIQPGYPNWCTFEIAVPTWAYSGNGTVYASVWNGTSVPYGREKSATFGITGGSANALGPQTFAEQNNTLTFRLRSQRGAIGNFTVYASSSYQNLYCNGTTTFNVYLPGDIGGPNGVPDGAVNGFDLYVLAVAWHTSIGNPRYNPRADIGGPNGVPDGAVNGFDLYVLATHWHWRVP